MSGAPNFDGKPVFFEKPVLSIVELGDMVLRSPRTGPPKVLDDLEPISCEIEYNPASFKDIIDKINLAPQEITITEEELIWLAPLGVRIVRELRIIKFMGYLKTFAPTSFPEQEGELPEAELTIIPVESA